MWSFCAIGRLRKCVVFGYQGEHTKMHGLFFNACIYQSGPLFWSGVNLRSSLCQKGEWGVFGPLVCPPAFPYSSLHKPTSDWPHVTPLPPPLQKIQRTWM